MADIFSYENNAVTTGEVASSDTATISIGGGGGANSLVQNCSVSYGQSVEEVTQVGSTSIFWMPGRAKGSVTVASLVGNKGFFSGLDQKCGIITTGTVSVGANRCGFTGNGQLTFEGGIIESVSATLSSQTQTIAQNMTMRIASLKNS